MYFPDVAGITLALAQSRLDAYLAAEEAALSNRSYTINGRSLTRQDLSEIRAGIDVWNSRVQQLARSGSLGPRLRLAEPL